MNVFEKFQSRKLVAIDKVLGGIQDCTCNDGSGGFSTPGGPGEIDAGMIQQVCGNQGADCEYRDAISSPNQGVGIG